MSKTRLRPNPFRPDKPITDFDLFAGRSEELKVLIEALYQVGFGNPRHLIITGPRGIGKSSFVNQVQTLGENRDEVLDELDIDAGDFEFNFAVFKYRAVRGQSLEQVISSLMEKTPTKITRENVVSMLGEFIKRWRPSVSVAGAVEIGLQGQDSNVSNLSADFIKTVRNLWVALKDDFDGIVFIIDEIDTIADNTNIASFLKVITEELIESGLDKIALYLVGITGVMDKLKEDHPSVARIFETVELRPLLDEEAKEVVARALDGSDTEIEGKVVDNIISIASGFPAPIHQIGYHAFKNDNDGVIAQDDFELAIDEVVTRIKREELSQLLRDAGSGDYRNILIAMAKYNSLIVPLGDIGKTINRSTSSMSSYMKALENRGVITKIDRAIYKITDPLLRLYIQKLDILEPNLPNDDAEVELIDEYDTSSEDDE